MNMGTLVLLFIAATWGLTFPLIKNSIAVVSPTFFNALRFDLAALTVFVFALVFRAKWTRNSVYAGLLSGGLLFGGYTCQSVGMQWTSATNAAFLVGLTVAWVPFFSLLLFREKITPKMASVLALALLALYLLSGAEFTSFTTGDLLQIAGTIFFSLQIIVLSRISVVADPWALNLIQLATIALLSHLFASGHNLSYSSVSSLRAIYPALLFNGILATAVAFGLQIWAQRKISASRTALILATEPVFGALFSFMVLGEMRPAIVYVGGILLFLCVIVAELSARRSQI